AQTLARFKHPNIVRVHAVFKENNTAYMVMEYEQGRGMHEILKEKNTLAQDELKKILLPILDGLAAIHAANFIHRDIKPPNIYIREDNNPVLLDFGSARQSLSEQTRTLTTMVSPGYAPFEQYVSKSNKQGPWTDIYGLGATMYRSVTGISPADSMDRSEAILHTDKDIFVPAAEIAKDQYSKNFLAAIDHALAFKPEDRPQTITAWRREFDSISVKSKVPEKLDQALTMKPTSEAETVAVMAKTARIKKESNITAEAVEQPSSFERVIDNTYRVIKKLLKWGLIILGILVLLAVLTNISRKKDEVMTGASSPEVTEPVIDSTTEIEPVVQPPDEAAKTAEEQERIIEQLLADAKADITALRLSSPAGNNAVEKYRKVLNLDPGNTEALQGLDNVVAEYLHLMDHALENDNLAQAGSYLRRARDINSGHPEIPAAQERLDAAHQAQLQKEQELLKEQELEEQQQLEQAVIQEEKIDEPQSLVPESERRALQSLKERISANPQDRAARQELRQLADKFEKNIRQAIENKEFDLAEDYVHEIQSVTDNPKTQKRLNELLRAIEKKKYATSAD
ncbi:MAG: serine/threonine protein kinase, partial [Gammaproteobacteria bacterium]|nr:serine/threonine protein kinase [Gammaproteobacteria bacterium]